MNHLVASIYFMAAVIAAVHGEMFTMCTATAISILSIYCVPPHVAKITINNPPGIRSKVDG